MSTDVLTYHDLVTLEAELMPWAACVGNEPLPVHPKEMLLAVQELMQWRNWVAHTASTRGVGDLGVPRNAQA